MKFTTTDIKKRMQAENISQRDLARKLGVTDRTVSRWISSNQKIPSKYFEKIKNILSLGIEEGFEESDYGFLHPPKSGKKLLSYLNLKTLNEYEYVTNEFGISSQELVRMAPSLLIAMSKLALEDTEKKVEQLEKLSAQLPPSWGPQNDLAKNLQRMQKKAVESQDAFKTYDCFHRFLSDVLKRINPTALFGAAQSFHEPYRKLTDIFDEKTNSSIHYAISNGIIDLAEINWNLWTHENREELLRKIIFAIEKRFEFFEKFIPKNEDGLETVLELKATLFAFLKIISDVPDLTREDRKKSINLLKKMEVEIKEKQLFDKTIFWGNQLTRNKFQSGTDNFE